jgi:hypothetical protein
LPCPSPSPYSPGFRSVLPKGTSKHSPVLALPLAILPSPQFVDHRKDRPAGARQAMHRQAAFHLLALGRADGYPQEIGNLLPRIQPLSFFRDNSHASPWINPTFYQIVADLICSWF